jgi:hypothetical protein
MSPRQDVSSYSSLQQVQPTVSSQNPSLQIFKSPRDETLTLVFEIVQEAQETLVNPRDREIKYIRRSKGERKTSVLLLITSLHKYEQE